jgi:hypothetical protein
MQLDDIGNPEAPVGSKPWARYYTLSAHKYLQHMDATVRDVRVCLESLHKGKAWEVLGCDDYDQWCNEHLGKPVALVKAVRLANDKQTMRELVEQQPALARHGGDHCSAAKKQVDNINLLKTPGGTDPAYLVARLKRDAPEVAERLADGEFRSVRAAAIEAGIVKVPTVFERVQKLLPKLTDEERQQLRDMLNA